MCIFDTEGHISDDNHLESVSMSLKFYYSFWSYFIYNISSDCYLNMTCKSLLLFHYLYWASLMLAWRISLYWYMFVVLIWFMTSEGFLFFQRLLSLMSFVVWPTWEGVTTVDNEDTGTIWSSNWFSPFWDDNEKCRIAPLQRLTGVVPFLGVLVFWLFHLHFGATTHSSLSLMGKLHKSNC